MTVAMIKETTLEERVLNWTEQLCEALEKQYVRYHKRMIEANTQRFDGNYSDYATKQLEEIADGTYKGIKFRIQTGRKYHKIIQQDFDTFRDRNEYRDGGVHAFVDKKTGEVYKPASWKSPAKHVRYDMRIIKEREVMLDTCDWAGGYLYMR